MTFVQRSILISGAGLALLILASAIHNDPLRFLPCTWVEIHERDYKLQTEAERECIPKQYEFMRSKREQAVENDSATWPKYENQRLGFSLKYPDSIAGKRVVFIESGNVTFVRLEGSPLHERQNELQGKNESTILLKAKEIEGESFLSWAIIIREAKGTKELAQFIDERFNNAGYGYKCQLGQLYPEDVTKFWVGIEEVHPAGTPGAPNSDIGSCWINWIYSFWYSPKHERMAYFDVGQDGNFKYDANSVYCSESNSPCDADWEMRNSFEFIERK